jgi:prepilin-type processing-associated H-X9-DG protein
MIFIFFSRSAFAMTDSGCEFINEEEFLLCVEHFEKNKSIRKYVLFLDGHASHSKNIHVLGFDGKNYRPISVCVHQPTAHRLQELDRCFLTTQSWTKLLF